MSVVPFNTSPASDGEASGQPEAPDARQRMLGVKRKLEEASGEIEALQSSLASQKELEKLLKQGRDYLQDLRNRLQQTAADRDGLQAERDRLQAELADSATAHQRDVEQLVRQMDGLREELQGATADRNRLASQLDVQEAAHKQFAGQYADERSTFTRLLDEAASIQRELTEEVQEQRRQIHTLRESAMRAQSFARDIIRAHEAAPPLPDQKPE
jgi:chromosome segregation ATPase